MLCFNHIVTLTLLNCTSLISYKYSKSISNSPTFLKSTIYIYIHNYIKLSVCCLAIELYNSYMKHKLNKAGMFWGGHVGVRCDMTTNNNT